MRTIELLATGCVGICAVDSNTEDHPNKLPFKGTLLIVDEPSTRPPNGAEGHRILVPKDIAEKNLKSLINMGVNYQPSSLKGHQPRHKVGVIEGAKIVGKEVQVWGSIWVKDFPEAKRELKANGLGMSMELANVLVKNKHDPIWKLIDFSFTGATVLYKNAAAYQKTSLAAASAWLQKILGGYAMAVKNKERKHKSSGNGQLVELVKILGSTMEKSIAKGLKPFGEKLESISASVEDHGKAIAEMAASHDNDSVESSAGSVAASADDSNNSNADSVTASADDSNKASDELEAAGDSSDVAKAKKKKKKIHAAKKKDDESSDDDGSMSDSADSDLEAELETLKEGAKGTKAGPDEESSNPEFGHLNKNAKLKGRKNSVNASTGVHHVVQIAARAHKRIGSLKAEVGDLRKKLRDRDKKVKKVEADLEEVQAQVSNFTENNMGPRALPPATLMLLSKGGYDINEMQANGQKLTVPQVDEMFASAGVTLSPMERITMKNHLLEKGLMEQGEVVRQ